MAIHSYSKCWLHLIWATLNREKLFFNSEIQQKVSEYLYDYSKSKEIFMRINHVNPDHVHALIDLPVQFSIEEMMHLLKGSSSHWINENKLIVGKFFWGRGYGAFSVSESQLDVVVNYIKNQYEHHRVKPFSEEYEGFMKVYGIKYIGDS